VADLLKEKVAALQAEKGRLGALLAARDAEVDRLSAELVTAKVGNDGGMHGCVLGFDGCSVVVCSRRGRQGLVRAAMMSVLRRWWRPGSSP
jgi:hypothetical protein